MKAKASLEKIQTRKTVTDDIIQTVTFNIYVSADEIGKLNEFYHKPLEITIQESES